VILHPRQCIFRTYVRLPWCWQQSRPRQPRESAQSEPCTYRAR